MIVLFAGLFFLAIFQLTAKRAEQRGVPEEALLPGDSRQFYKPYSEVPYSEVTDESQVNTAAEQ
ncbi:MAG: hypothetical protein KDD70_19050 [Bdellovibrionales bacterium]|nr:hypothetical protein [Bdellovibrionales bacterium]